MEDLPGTTFVTDINNLGERTLPLLLKGFLFARGTPVTLSQIVEGTGLDPQKAISALDALGETVLRGKGPQGVTTYSNLKLG